MLFSVIIPCFNSENHISTCLKYLLAQINSDDDIEVLLVDDGSNDNTLSIISEYKEKYPYYIKIIKNEKNRGVSYSRNVGIYNSIGKFILFLDSDDQYKDGLFIELRNIIKKSSDIDIVSFSFLREGGKDKSETIYSFKEFNKKIFYNIDFFKLFCIKKINQHICSAAFRRELLISNNIFFDLGTYIGEDVEFQIKSILYAKKIYYSSTIFFIYKYNSQSVTNNKLSEKHLSFGKIYPRLKKIISDKNLIPYLSFYYTYSFFYILYSFSEDKNLVNKFSIYDSILKDRMYINISNKKSLITFISKVVYKINKKIFLSLLNFFKRIST